MIDWIFAVMLLIAGLFATISGVAMFIVDFIRERKDSDWKTTGEVNTVVLLAGVLTFIGGVEYVYEIMTML